jgi:D-glycero-D-manno-heptose 1,7-bisphosphate phosphatase
MAGRPAQVGDDLIWTEVFSPPRRASCLFLDRDGVVIEDAEYLSNPDGVRLIDGAAEAIRRSRRAGVHVVLVTNQSGIARGYYGWDEFAAVQARLEAMLADLDAGFDAVLACPFHAEGRPPFRHPAHPCRKPNPGMLLKAAGLLDIDLPSSWIIGDRTDDIGAGANAGLAGGIHVLTGHGASHRGRVGALAGVDYRVDTADNIAVAADRLPWL